MSPRVAAIALTTAVVLASAFASVLAKLTLRDVAPLTFAWLQVVFGGVCMSVYTFVWRRERIPRNLGPKVWGYIVWIGICNFAIVRIFLITSLERLPATTSPLRVAKAS